MRTLSRAHHRATSVLRDDAATALRLLGVYPGPTAAIDSVAALAGVRAADPGGLRR